MDTEMVETASSAGGQQTSAGDDSLDALPLTEAIEQAVRQVTQTFSKPAPDRDRLFLAVQAVVSGDMTIKEAAVTYQFATSTMHPYVHRARATLGERAPPVKINRPTMRRRPQTQQSSSLLPAQSPHETSSGVGAVSDDHAIDLSIKGNEAGKPTAAAAAVVDEDEPGQLIIDESVSVKCESLEDAARDAIRLLAGDFDSAARDNLLHSVLRSLNDCSTAPKATSAASGDGTSPSQLVADCVDRARALLASKDESGLQIRVTTPSLDEIEEATKRVIKGSHYHGADKERLFKAVVQTVRGDLPLTQAAATHSIPFSTLHPYVKKVRVHLGIIEASDDMKKSPSGHKRAAASNESSPDQAKRSKRHSSSTGGSSGTYQPFKQLDIPQSWKDNSEVMETAVWGAVQGCQYDDPQKKERLCSAVMEALSGRKTMKAAAAMHEVPFTTLQTYFHRSRARLQRAYGQIPDSDLDDADVSGAEEDINIRAASDGGKIALTPTTRGSKRKGSALDSLLVKLTGQPATVDGTNDADGPAAPPLFDGTARERTPPASGSNKRKPKKVVRLAESNGGGVDDGASASVKQPTRAREGAAMPANAGEMFMAQFLALAAAAAQLNGQTTIDAGQVVAVEPKAPEEDNNDYMWDSFDQTIDFTIDASCSDADELLRTAERDDEVIDERRDRLADNQCLQGKIVMTNELAVDRAILNSPYEGENHQRLKWAVLDTLDGTSTAKEASREYVIPLSALNTYCSRARAILDAIKNGDEAETVLRGSTTSTPKADRKRKRSGTPTLPPSSCKPLDVEDADRIALIEEAVDNACKSSLYPGPQKERLREAVMLVIKGDMTINAAANMKQLPSSTVHPYVHRARAALGADLPPQATGPTPWPAYGSKKKAEDESADSPMSRSEASPSPALSTASSVVSKMKTTPLALSTAAEELGLSAKKLDGMSAKATLRMAKQAALEHTANGPTVNLEEADKAIGELVKSSLYDDAGRQRLYEAILMVVTDNATASEAARTYQIPPSTIQPYVQRARAALGMPIYTIGASPTANGLLSKKNGALGAPKVYAKPGEEATEDDVYKVVQQVVSNCNAHESRRGKLLDAVFAAVAGKSTIKDACTSQGLPASTVHPYVSRARHILGDKCPTPKTIAVSSTAGSSSGAPSPAPSLSGEEDNNNSTPTTLKAANLLLAKKGSGVGGVADTVAFTGDRTELRAQLIQIMGRYNFRGDRTKMVDAIAMVIGDNKTLADVSQSTGLAQTTLSTYVRLAKLFLKPKPAAPDDDEDPTSATVGVDNDCPPPNITIGVEIDPPADKDAQPAQAVTSSAISPDAAVVKDLKEKSIMALLEDADENDQETRFRVVVSHLVSQQFKRGATAQQKMTDAVEDVLLNGLSVAESLRIHGGMSEHVLNVYVNRTRDVLSCFDEPLADLLAAAARITRKKPDGRRRSSTAINSPPLSPTTPTRSSRRLQARHSAEHQPDTTVSSGSFTDDSPISSAGEQQLPAEFEVVLVEYFKKLEEVNFPITAKFAIGLVKHVGTKHASCALNLLTDAAWSDWWTQFRKRHAIGK